MIKRSPTMQPMNKFIKSFVRTHTKSARDLSIKTKNISIESSFVLPPLTPVPLMEDSSRLLSFGKVKKIGIRDNISSISKNLQRLAFNRQKTYSAGTSQNTMSSCRTSITYKNDYIDSFYPNGSDSKFPNKVPLPGDWNFNKKMYQDDCRHRARKLEAKLSAVTEEVSSDELETMKPGINIACSQLELYGSVPEITSSSSLVHHNGKLYLYGGQQYGRYHDLHSFNLRNHNWSALNTSTSPPSRCGHSAVVYMDSLIVYGGETKHKKTVADSLAILHLPTLTWHQDYGSGDLPLPRKNHGAALFGNTMVVFGGQCNSEQALDSLYILDLASLTWSIPEFTYTRHPDARFNCSLTTVFPTSTESVWDSYIIAREAKYECGFYLIGGENEKELSDVWILKFTHSKCFWTLVEPPLPRPRTQHTACAVNEILALIGGRSPFGQEDAIALYLLRTQKWVYPQINGKNPLCRWKHASTALQSKILIFGGISDIDLIDRKLEVIETSQDAIKKLLQKSKSSVNK